MSAKNTLFPEARWKWFGNAGHFCASAWCRFHLATVVGPWLISTVGEYIHPRHSGGNEQSEFDWIKEHWPGEDIGAGRKYETMVFRAGKKCKVKGCECGLPDHNGHEIDFLGYNDARSATKGHLFLCQKWAKITRAGKSK